MKQRPFVHANPVLTEWLNAQDSLTARLEQLIGAKLGVRVLDEGYRLLLNSEKKQLGLPLSRPIIGWLRIVYLYDKSANIDPITPLVRAISIFPINSLVGDARRLTHLKSTPIGYVLFKKNRTLLCQRQIFYLKNDPSIHRQTVYEWRGRKLLIKEEFSENLQKLLE